MRPDIREIPILAIDVGDRFRKDLGDLTQLRSSIEQHGLIHPIAVAQKGESKFLLMAGGRRLAACIELGRPTILARIYPPPDDELDLRLIELAENLHKAMNFAEEVALKKRIHDLQIERYGKKAGPGPSEGWSERNTAEFLGISHTHLSEDLRLAEALETYPELRELPSKRDALSALNRLQERMVREEIARRTEGSLSEFKRRLAESYVVGDFFQLCHAIEDGSVDLCEVDPPYGLPELHSKMDDEQKDDFHVSDMDDFIKHTAEVCYAKLRPNGWMLLWQPFERVMQSTDILRDVGFTVVTPPAIWYKAASALRSGGLSLHTQYNMPNAYECMIYARKGDAMIVNVGRPNVFDFRTRPSKIVHPTQRPIELMQEILQTFALPGSMILVPFAGSGVTLLAAATLGMPAVGFDISDRYRPYFIEKVSEL